MQRIIFKKICLGIMFFGIFSFAYADTCPVKTVGLSRTNYSGKQGEVLALQIMLAKEPEIYPEGVMSGTFGPATERALKKLQSDNGLVSSGKLDTDTIDHVCTYYNVCPFQTLLLGQGSEETFEINVLQSLLTYLGYYSSGVMGSFGPKTEAGLKKYQKAKSIYDTGIIDYDTQDELCKTFTNLSVTKTTTTKTTSSGNTSSVFKASCYSSPNPAKTNQQITFYSSVSGGTAPYTYS